MTAPEPAPDLRRLRRFALAAVVTNIGIVITGGVVRVTGSGLGCPDWPTCDGRAVTPVGGDHEGWHVFIEFGNRLLTFVVLAAVVAVLVEVRRQRPQARPLEPLAWALVGGVLTQAAVGGVTVLTGLAPLTVAVHFLLSMALIAVAVTLHQRLRPGPAHAPPPIGLRHATSAVVWVALVVLVLGTLVTGAGPHGGDPGASRLGLDIRVMAIAHADAVWLLVGVTAASMLAGWRTGPPAFRRGLRLLLVVQLAQGGIGYLQYVLGIPPALVSLHIAGASVMWALAVGVWVAARPELLLPAARSSSPPLPTQTADPGQPSGIVPS